MKKKIYHKFIIIGILAVSMTFIFAAVLFYDLFKIQVIEDLKTYANVLKDNGIENLMENQNYNPYPDNLRITLIAPDGTVQKDSDADADKMENHSDREEVKEAVQNGEGYAVRHSETLDKNTFYYAVRLDNGDIMRVANEAGSIWHVFQKAIPTVVVIVIIILVICMILAYFLTRGIVAPIEQMAENMDNLERIPAYRELVPFINTIQKQHEDIVKNAQVRQDFTANVSHELKTPLTSISGYSELIQSGMVNGEDISRFAGEIHQGSQRLLTLINDIIRLSELDVMDADIIFEPIDLCKLSQNCVDMLQVNAEKHHVTLTLSGRTTTVYANKEMMEELLYNLCDNAIRYNNPGGSVHVTVMQQGNEVILTVKDTGIGIPKEYQERIFERFYRVDKSRSKSTGGTGLGLAIVKHIVAQHHAQMKLDSEVGKGTTIKIIFPNKDIG